MTNTHVDTRSRAVAVVEIVALALVIGAALATPFVPSARAANWTVYADGIAFVPDYMMVEVGDTVTWTNNDSATHTVTSNSGAWTELNLPAGGSASHTFDAVGSYAYHCRLHPSMTGTIEVVTVIPEFSTMPLVLLGLLVMFVGLAAARRRR